MEQNIGALKATLASLKSEQQVCLAKEKEKNKHDTRTKLVCTDNSRSPF
jgi:hypothetical protein